MQGRPPLDLCYVELPFSSEKEARLTKEHGFQRSSVAELRRDRVRIRRAPYGTPATIALSTHDAAAAVSRAIAAGAAAAAAATDGHAVAVEAPGELRFAFVEEEPGTSAQPASTWQHVAVEVAAGRLEPLLAFCRDGLGLDPQGGEHFVAGIDGFHTELVSNPAGSTIVTLVAPCDATCASQPPLPPDLGWNRPRLRRVGPAGAPLRRTALLRQAVESSAEWVEYERDPDRYARLMHDRGYVGWRDWVSMPPIHIALWKE